jgi:hypothetical protein
MSDIVYTGIFFNSSDILQCWKDLEEKKIGLPEIPEGGNVHAKHMTIQFRPDDAHVNAIPMGRRVKVQITGFVADLNAIAMSVDIVRCVGDDGSRYSKRDTSSLVDGIANPIPHITLWTADGVPPKYSNELLANGITKFESGCYTLRPGYHTLRPGTYAWGTVGAYSSEGRFMSNITQKSTSNE